VRTYVEINKSCIENPLVKRHQQNKTTNKLRTRGRCFNFLRLYHGLFSRGSGRCLFTRGNFHEKYWMQIVMMVPMEYRNHKVKTSGKESNDLIGIAETIK
jgi:hypothetical protein